VNQPADSTLFARVLAKTNEYLDFPSVVGHETPFLDHLARDFTALGCSVERPQNLCIIRLNEPGPVYLAHADRHGAVIAEDGAAVYAAQAVKNTKYADGATHTEAFAATVSKRYEGEDVFAYDRKTGGRLAYGNITSARIDDQNRLVVEIEDLPPLPGGTPVAFARDVTRNKSGHVSGQLDNPVSLAALRIAAEFGLKGTIIVTAEEEIGRSAGHFLSWAQAGGLKPTNELVVCDTSPFDDAAACMAGAVILRRRDATSSFHDAMVNRLETAASRAGAPMIFKDSFIARENDARARRELPLKSMGLTELGRITADSQGDYAGATLQLPTYNYHSNEETTSVKALTAFVRTLLAI
tara:strand:+ start:2226 stop:3287 length:1062 start_codon:yes stop_codon:yes gene_type:complete